MATATKKQVGVLSIGSIYSGPDDFQTQEDLRTLSRAQMIKKDKKRFAAAMKLAQEQISLLENIDPSVEAGEDAKEGEKDD